MLTLAYGNIYRARLWNINDVTGHKATIATVTGHIVVTDLVTGTTPIDEDMDYQADADMFFDIPAEVATLGRQVSIILTATSVPVSPASAVLLATKRYDVEYTDNSV